MFFSLHTLVKVTFSRPSKAGPPPWLQVWLKQGSTKPDEQTTTYSFLLAHAPSEPAQIHPRSHHFLGDAFFFFPPLHQPWEGHGVSQRGRKKKIKKIQGPGAAFSSCPTPPGHRCSEQAAALSCKWQGAGTPRGTPAPAPGKGCPAEVGLGVLGGKGRAWRPQFGRDARQEPAVSSGTGGD